MFGMLSDVNVKKNATISKTDKNECILDAY